MEKMEESAAEELIEVDIQLLCRVCGTFYQDLIPIYEEGDGYEISKKIEEYIPFISVTESEILPKKICIQCIKTLLTWHKFIICCTETNLRFENMIKESEELSFHDDIVESIEYLQDNESGDDSTKEEIFSEFSLSKDEEKSFIFNNKDNEELEEQEGEEEEQEQQAEAESKDIIEAIKHNRFLKSTRTSRCSKSEENFVCSEETENNKLKTILTPKKGKYDCIDCNYQTDKKTFIENHIIDKHPEYDSTTLKKLRPRLNKKLAEENKIIINDKIFYKCPECEKQLYTLYTFSWHMLIHSGEKPFICYLCGKTFRVSQGVARHIKDKHEKCKDFPCDICGRKFSNRRNVIEHRRLHTNERPYSCPECNKTFKQKASLFVHKRCHLPTFQYKCETCDQGFRSKGQMKVHMTLHSGEKAHECHICQRKFRIKHELNRHILIHSDLKPFSCNECGNTFRQKRYLLRHFKTHHPEKSEKN